MHFVNYVLPLPPTHLETQQESCHVTTLAPDDDYDDMAVILTFYYLKVLIICAPPLPLHQEKSKQWQQGAKDKAKEHQVCFSISFLFIYCTNLLSQHIMTQTLMSTPAATTTNESL